MEIPQLAIPQTVEDAEKTDTQFENNKRIVIHAMDRDRGKIGWAAHIPSLFEDRVPMKLDKTIRPKSLFTKRQITGDVLIVYKLDEEENRIPSEIHLLENQGTKASAERPWSLLGATKRCSILRRAR